MSGDLFFAALQAARSGWRVFPVRGKRPYFALWRDLATTDVHTIEHWFGDVYRHAGLGAIPPARIVRLDVDVKGDGRGTVRRWRRSQLGLSDTLTVRTPSGGAHMYFTGGDDLKEVRLAPGVELKVGAVILPPTRGYRWIGYGDERPAELPDWLRARAQHEARKARDERRRAGFALGNTTLDEVARRITIVTQDEPLVKASGYLSFSCPAHESRHRRSAWAVETDHGVRVGCFAHCSPRDIVAALESAA